MCACCYPLLFCAAVLRAVLPAGLFVFTFSLACFPVLRRFDLSCCAHACMCNYCCLKQAVGRGARTPLMVGDMPFGSYEISPEEALRTSIRFVKVRTRTSQDQGPRTREQAGTAAVDYTYTLSSVQRTQCPFRKNSRYIMTRRCCNQAIDVRLAW